MASENKESKTGLSQSEKKYVPVCAVLCVVGVILGVLVFFSEMYLSYFFTYNNTLTGKWKSTDVRVIGLAGSPDEVSESARVDFPHFGDVTYILRYNYVAYGLDKSHGGNNEEKAYFGIVKVGDKISGYFKPDNPDVIAFKIPYVPFIVSTAVLFVIVLLLALWARFISKSIIASRPMKFNKNRTVKRKIQLSFMDIAVAALIGIFLICFLSGMIIGASKVGKEYTEIDQSLASSLSSTTKQSNSSDY